MKSRIKNWERKIFKLEIINLEITHKIIYYQRKINKILLKFMKCLDSNILSI